MDEHQDQLSERIILPSTVDLSEAAAAALVAQLASRIAPGLERSVGPVQWRVGDATGVDWTAEGFVEGAFVVVCLRPSSREVSLLVDPRFSAPAGQKSKQAVFLLLGALAAGIVVGAMKRSFGWAFASFVAVVTASICTDAVRHQLRVRRAIAHLDRAAWSRRFQGAVATSDAREPEGP
jgi:hypothetical protein